MHPGREKCLIHVATNGLEFKGERSRTADRIRVLIGDEPRLPLTMGDILAACSRPTFHVKHWRMPSGEGRVYIRLGPLTPWSIATAPPFMMTNMSSARLHLLGYTTLWRHPGSWVWSNVLSMSPSGRQLKSECVRLASIESHRHQGLTAISTLGHSMITRTMPADTGVTIQSLKSGRECHRRSREEEDAVALGCNGHVLLWPTWLLRPRILFRA